MNALTVIAKLGAGTVSLFVGTYTSPGSGQGIYRVLLDERTGELSRPTLVAKAANPSFLAIGPDGSTLYAVDESTNGSVGSYRFGPDGRLRLLNRQPVPGGAPCFLSLDRTGRNLLVAGYSGGFVSSLQIRTDGQLTPVKGQLQNKGTGPNKDRQEGPHMHWIATDPSGRLVYSCDLGADKVRIDRFNPTTGTLTPTRSSGESPPGSGPRHAAFGSHGRFLYVANEMDDSVSVFRVNRTTGALELLQTMSALQGGRPKEGCTAAEIECHPNGRWLYVSNRGEDGIAVFGIKPSGLLELVQIKPLPVRMPRSFAIDPSGHWLVVAGQESNDLVALPIDGHAGRLGEGVARAAVGSPACVIFGMP